MATTLGDIVDWLVKDKLNRRDLTSVVTGLAKDAMLSICAKIPFDELSTIGSEIPCVYNQQYLDLASLNLAGIISLRLTDPSTGIAVRLKRSAFRAFDQMQILAGKPYQYARVGKKIYFNRLPPSSPAYTVRPYYWSQATLSAVVTDTALPWPVEWDELLKYETLYRLYLFLEQHDRAMALIQSSPLPRQSAPTKVRIVEMGFLPRLWNDLLRTTSAKEGIDEDFSINPYIQTYMTR